MSTFSWKTAPCHARKYTARGDKRQSLPDTCGIDGSLRGQSEEPWKNVAPGIRRSGCRGRCSGDDGRCQRKSGALVRESFPLVPEPLWDCLGAVPKDRRLVCRILFDAEDGSVVGVNDHIEDLSILDDFNLVLAFFVFVFRLGRVPPTFCSAALMAWGRVVFALVTLRASLPACAEQGVREETARAERRTNAAAERRRCFFIMLSPLLEFRQVHGSASACEKKVSGGT